MQVLASHLTTVPLVILTARPYGIWRDLLFRLGGAKARMRRLLLDTIAFLSFQMPVYVAILALAGATPDQIARAVGGGSS